jgi:hypothetical protein
LPCQAAPTTAFRWLFRTILALEVPFLHAYRQAGWDMAELVRRPELLRLCGQGMHEAARSVRAEAGVIAMASALVPGGILARIARRRARRASADFREVWRHHGPKTEDQLRYLTAQLLDRAGSTPQRALGALSAT